MDRQIVAMSTSHLRTNEKQYEVILKFVHTNQWIRRGGRKDPTSGVSSRRAWDAIGLKLNSLGPPVRDGAGWAKTWRTYRRKFPGRKSESGTSRPYEKLFRFPIPQAGAITETGQSTSVVHKPIEKAQIPHWITTTVTETGQSPSSPVAPKPIEKAHIPHSEAAAITETWRNHPPYSVVRKATHDGTEPTVSETLEGRDESQGVREFAPTPTVGHNDDDEFLNALLSNMNKCIKVQSRIAQTIQETIKRCDCLKQSKDAKQKILQEIAMEVEELDVQTMDILRERTIHLRQLVQIE